MRVPKIERFLRVEHVVSVEEERRCGGGEERNGHSPGEQKDIMCTSPEVGHFLTLWQER
jgi:hypothetical protein